jgi:hypothetical protein
MPAQLDRRGTHIAKAFSQVRPGARPFDFVDIHRPTL